MPSPAFLTQPPTRRSRSQCSGERARSAASKGPGLGGLAGVTESVAVVKPHKDKITVKHTMKSPSVEDVLREEVVQIENARRLRLHPDEGRPGATNSLVGLAFSGGGIRSATFNLGILQALAKAQLLRSFDYISTVSGGGYIGSWLMAWMSHQRRSEEHTSELQSQSN